jgi:cbb3-type cytochrome oxidase subunit 1
MTQNNSANSEKFYYDNTVVKNFGIASAAWGAISVLVGVLIAIQLFLPAANFGTSFLTFGRLRALHTNGAIFAFVGNLIFMGETTLSLIMQRNLRVRISLKPSCSLFVTKVICQAAFVPATSSGNGNSWRNCAGSSTLENQLGDAA